MSPERRGRGDADHEGCAIPVEDELLRSAPYSARWRTGNLFPSLTASHYRPESCVIDVGSSGTSETHDATNRSCECGLLRSRAGGGHDPRNGACHPGSADRNDGRGRHMSGNESGAVRRKAEGTTQFHQPGQEQFRAIVSEDMDGSRSWRFHQRRASRLLWASLRSPVRT